MNIFSFIYVAVLAFVFMLFSKNKFRAILISLIFALILMITFPYIEKVNIMEGAGFDDCNCNNLMQVPTPQCTKSCGNPPPI